jgi:hypothetical protein
MTKQFLIMIGLKENFVMVDMGNIRSLVTVAVP